MHLTRKAIEERIKSIDVVIEMLDARLPGSSANPMLAQLIKNKPGLKVLSKQDLADPARTALWLAHYNAQPNTRAIALDTSMVSPAFSCARSTTASCRGVDWSPSAVTWASSPRSMRRSLAASKNVPSVRLLRAAGLDDTHAFLARFEPGGQGVGFAVLGGAFGEGIDLPGDRLVGAFVATLGLPQVNPLNERLRQCLQDAFGAGFDYAYLVPGLRKVVQAAGRVIRTPEDRGTVFLIDDRFCRADVRALLPGWWEPAVWRGHVTDEPRPAG